MGIPLVVGWGDKIKRTGASFHAQCPQCERVVKMFEATKNFNVRLFFAVSLWDDEEPAVQCGECLALFAGDDADRVRAAAQSKPSLVGAVGSVFSKLRSSGSERPPPRSRPPQSRPPPSPRRTIDEAAVDAELAAMKKRLGK